MYISRERFVTDTHLPMAAAEHRSPLLATPEQVAADKALFKLLRDPQIETIQAKLRAELAATPVGMTQDGASRLDGAIAQFTNSVIFKELATNQADPGMIMLVDNTPREWLGYSIPGIGMAGDNPDNVNRVIVLDGDSTYELDGKFDMANRPAQFVIQVARGDGSSTTPTKKNAIGTDRLILATLTDRELVINPDGSFRITIGGPAAGPNHLATESGVVVMNTRDSMSDWSQRPVHVTLRRIAGAGPPPFDLADLRQRVHAKLEPFLRYWGHYHKVWFGGLQPNTVGGPVARDGDWGFAAGLRYKLAPDEAAVVTMSSAGSNYTGFQVTDLWLIGPDARRYQNSLNLSQTTPDADGRFTYVIGPSDPGVANWLDTFGLHEGFGVLRWQGCSPGTSKNDIMHGFRVIKVADANRLPGIAPIAAEQRRARIAARAHAYNLRFH
jgi:hypothetical protein